MHRIVATLVALCVSMLAGLAMATPRLDVAHVQGRDAPWVVGWNEAVVQLDNADGAAWRGELSIDPSYDRKGADRPSVRVSVTLAAGEGARLVLPFFLQPGTWPTVVLSTASEGEVATHALGLTRPLEGVATIVEVQGKEARAAKLVDVPPAGSDDEKDFGIAPPPIPHHFKPGHPPPTVPMPAPSWGVPASVQVSTVQMARESSDPILPDVAAGWSGAVVVMIPSDILTRLQGRQLDSLAQWVLSGGTLAVYVVREEDLRSPTLKTFLGGEARMTSGASTTTTTFAGGNLHRGDVSKEGDDGDVADYGLGEVWLLRRNPWARTPDPKSPKTVFALWSRAKTHRGGLMSLPAGLGLRWYDDDRVRKFLDPNHGFRPALGIAAVLVIIYAFLVGPIAFGRARKLGKPLSVLRITPLLAIALFAVLVGIGKVGKGIRGRVRKIAVVDVGGGATRAAATTFHAFYVGDPGAVELTASHPTDAVHVVEPFVDSSPIDLDRDVIAVRSIRSHPWQTLVVSEEGIRDVQGGVVLEGNGMHLTLINKTPYTLEHVILHPETTATSPAKSRYFATVPPGGIVVARDGIAVERRVRPVSISSGVSDTLLKKDDRMIEAIDAFEALIAVWTSATYPNGVAVPVTEPMATAYVTLPAGGKESGFAIERDVMLLRVMGLGGGKGKGEIEPEKPGGKEKEL